MNTASKGLGFGNIVNSFLKQEPDKENEANSKQTSIASEIKGFERKGWNVNKNIGATKTVETHKQLDNSVLSESFKDLSINKPSHGGLTINGCKNLAVHQVTSN